MYCKYCGSQIQDQSRFCSCCGKELTRKNRKNVIQDMDMSESDKGENGVMPNNAGVRTQAESCGSQYGKYERGTPQTGQEKSRRVFKKVLYLLYGLFLLCALFYFSNPDNNILHIRDMRKAYKYATEVLEEEVLVTDHEFPKFESCFVNQKSKNVVFEGHDYRVYTVSAYVYDENVFGTRMKTRYVVEIGFPTDKNVDGIYYNIVSYGDY